MIPLDDLVLFNGGAQCDMRTGPCACGATHTEEEWTARIVREHSRETTPTVWHYMPKLGVSGCGADYRNMAKTEVVEHVTCSGCLTELERELQRKIERENRQCSGCGKFGTLEDGVYRCDECSREWMVDTPDHEAMPYERRVNGRVDPPCGDTLGAATPSENRTPSENAGLSCSLCWEPVKVCKCPAKVVRDCERQLRRLDRQSAPDPAREELRFIKSYLSHQDQDADHGFLVRRINDVLAGRDPSPEVTAALAEMQPDELYTPCTDPYPDCTMCKGTGILHDHPCDNCVWRKWYADGVASDALRTPEEVEANRENTSREQGSILVHAETIRAFVLTWRASSHLVVQTLLDDLLVKTGVSEIHPESHTS